MRYLLSFINYYLGTKVQCIELAHFHSLSIVVLSSRASYNYYIYNIIIPLIFFSLQMLGAVLLAVVCMSLIFYFTGGMDYINLLILYLK